MASHLRPIYHVALSISPQAAPARYSPPTTIAHHNVGNSPQQSVDDTSAAKTSGWTSSWFGISAKLQSAFGIVAALTVQTATAMVSFSNVERTALHRSTSAGDDGFDAPVHHFRRDLCGGARSSAPRRPKTGDDPR
jgi:hypothetical protein